MDIDNELVRAADERAIGSRRRALSGVLVAYAIALFVACGVLVCVRLDESLFWSSFVFWRFALTALGIVVLAFTHDFVVRTCGIQCPTPPGGIVPLIMLVVYELWCIVVVGFMVHDVVNCAARPWCAGTGSTPNGYYLAWFIGFGIMTILQLVILAFVFMLRMQLTARCATPCGASGGAYVRAPSGRLSDIEAESINSEFAQPVRRRGFAANAYDMLRVPM